MFYLTKQEKGAIFFLAAVTISGIGINFLVKNVSRAAIIPSMEQDLGKVDLNNSDKQALKTVKGIGDVMAQRIIDRRSCAGFTQVEELRTLKGMSKARYERIKDKFIAR